MPTPVEIEIFNISRTTVDRNEVERWLQRLGCEEFVIPEEEAISDPALLIALAGKRCYLSFEKGLNPNITQIREDYVKYFDNILASGHGSVCEHSVYSFAIEGVSRIFTAEMNRHRAGWAISEGSLRFIRFGDTVPYWEPTSITGSDIVDGGLVNAGIGYIDAIDTRPSRDGMPDDEYAAVTATWARQVLRDAAKHNGFSNELCTNAYEVKKQLSRAVFREAFAGQESWYRVLEIIWADELAPASPFKDKKHITSMMRRIIGLGVSTGGVWTGNIRALRHVFAMRSSPAAEEEMLHVFSRLVKVMMEKEPLLFGDFYQDDNGFWRPKYPKV